MRSHARDDDKDYWDRVIAITSKDMNLTKAHVRYLESRLIALLKEARKTVIMNRTDPGFERLPEADVADMETFLDEIQLILPVVGIDYLRRPQAAPVPSSDLPSAVVQVQSVADPQHGSGVFSIEQPAFVLAHAAKGISARALEVEGEFVILAGATGSLNDAPSFRDNLRVLREQALESARAVPASQSTFRLTQDIAFSSPSAAAMFLFGTSRNGRTDWLVEGTSQTYGAYKDNQLDGVLPFTEKGGPEKQFFD